VNRATLLSKLDLSRANPVLLDLADYEIHSLVSSSAISDFLEVLSSSKFVITTANCASLTLLSEEFDFVELSEACKEFAASHGRESGQNFVKAAEDFRVTADRGCSSAQVNYGLCLKEGDGVAKNVAEVGRYFKMAADQGHAYGQHKHGFWLEEGKGVTKNVGG
jgi:hypothetical protein